jgi:hypothetical protein
MPKDFFRKSASDPKSKGILYFTRKVKPRRHCVAFKGFNSIKICILFLVFSLTLGKGKISRTIVSLLVLYSNYLSASIFKGHLVQKRQVLEQNGLVIKEWWLDALYRLIPFIFDGENSVPTPVIFLPHLENSFIKFLVSIGFPTILFDDSGPYSFNKLAVFVFGINLIQLIGISLLVFTASIALVSLLFGQTVLSCPQRHRQLNFFRWSSSCRACIFA